MTSNRNGLTAGGLLTVVVITLKLTNEIDWPWIWVLLPIWAPLGVFVLVFAVLYLYHRFLYRSP